MGGRYAIFGVRFPPFFAFVIFFLKKRQLFLIDNMADKDKNVNLLRP